jgi:predicted enzyme related to lactoylglutathione lyase
MNLLLQHVEVHVSSIDLARDFYVDKLGLEVLEEVSHLNLISLKAGGVRISIFGGYETSKQFEKKTGTHLILRTENLHATRDELIKRGMQFTGDIFEAPGFLRCITTTDPDGNVIEIAEYLRDPLQKNS